TGGRRLAGKAREIRARVYAPAIQVSLSVVGRHSQMIAQMPAGIFRAENTAALEFRHDVAGKSLDAGGVMRRHGEEAVAGIGLMPFLHCVGDRGWRADEFQIAALG